MLFVSPLLVKVLATASPPELVAVKELLVPADNKVDLLSEM